MQPDEKELIRNVVSVSAVAVFLHAVVEVPLHEYGHYWVASWLGAPLYIDGERTIWVAGDLAPPHARTLIFLAGGLCAAAVLLVLYALMKKPYRDGALALIPASLVYAPLDATDLGHEISLVVFIAVWILTIVRYLARFLGWRLPGPIGRTRVQA